MHFPVHQNTLVTVCVAATGLLTSDIKIHESFACRTYNTEYFKKVLENIML
jgi:hypothetical protein